MAIVFVSPQKKQRAFLWIVIALLIVVLGIIAALVLLPDYLGKAPAVSVDTSFMSKIAINLDVFDSDNVKNLQPVGKLVIGFGYQAQDQLGQQVSGSIFAKNKQEAQANLEASGLKVGSLKEINIGRDNPFVSY